MYKYNTRILKVNEGFYFYFKIKLIKRIKNFCPLLEKFVINSLFKWSLVLKYKSQIKYLLCFKKISIRFLSKYFKLLDIILFFIKFFLEIEKAIYIPT